MKAGRERFVLGQFSLFLAFHLALGAPGVRRGRRQHSEGPELAGSKKQAAKEVPSRSTHHFPALTSNAS